MKYLHIVCDLQFGSTGKGQVAGVLAKALQIQVVATAWGPNAGHTYVDPNGIKYIHTMLANSLVHPGVRAQLIGPGTVLDMDKLFEEAVSTGPVLQGKDIIIHPNACVRMPRHLDAEKPLVRIGSTMKGTAAAVVEKLWRDPEHSPLVRDAWGAAAWKMWYRRFEGLGILISRDDDVYDNVVDSASRLMIEGAQGFSLGIHTLFWPYTTSRDVSPAQMMADCRIPFNQSLHRPTVWGVARTYPIRVANRFKDGVMVGHSGPHYWDQVELDWRENLDREPELTTVTKLPRRVFSFSESQVRQAVRICGVTNISITFGDYLAPKPVHGTALPAVLVPYVHLFRKMGATVRYVHFGPGERDIMALDEELMCRDLSPNGVGVSP